MELDIENEILSQNKIIPFACKVCGYVAATKDELKTHSKESHGRITPIGRSSLASSVASLSLRGFLGSVMILHGLPKLGDKKEETIENMESIGVPKEATISSSLLEVVGGASLLAGFMVPVVSSLFAVEMVGAAILSKEKMGQQFLSTRDKPAYEIDAMYAVAFSTLAAIGGGEFSIDRLLGL